MSDDLRHALKHLMSLASDAWKDCDIIKNHIAALEADNAALLTTGNRVHDLAQHDEACTMLVGNDLAMCDCAMGEWQQVQRDAHPGATLLEEHRKALVRARNEGKEDVAQACLTKRDSIMRGVKPGTRRGGLEEAASIARAMKEPEECVNASCAKCRSGEPCR